MTKLLAPLGLAVMTGSQRDALGTPDDGQLIWNSDEERVERSSDGDWEAVAMEPAVADAIGALAVDLGRIRSALRLLDVDPDLFDPDMH